MSCVVKEKEAGKALARRSNQDPCPKNAQAREIHLLRINVSLDKTTIVGVDYGIVAE
jgi:hypothetical protein